MKRYDVRFHRGGQLPIGRFDKWKHTYHDQNLELSATMAYFVMESFN